jgi:fumarylacetoacetase
MPMLSFIDVARESHFPIQNLPYGVFSPGTGRQLRVGVAIGDWVLDLQALDKAGLFEGTIAGQEEVFSRAALNDFMALGQPAWKESRAKIQELLAVDNPRLRDDAVLRQRTLLPVESVVMHLPADIGDYTDFYSSREHATNVGSMFRGQKNALQPNWLHLPVAYHGRASSVVVSGTDIRRPYGQILDEQTEEPAFKLSQEMDFELEVGTFLGPGNRLGEPVAVGDAAEHIFGMVLVNDWSARDIQRWEYRPLGPFLSKNLATSISPWVVTMEALAPFRCAGPDQVPEPLGYLRSKDDWAYDIQLEVFLQSEAMVEPVRISRTNFRTLYWNMAQQLAHHASSGCNMRPGDLLASGTISGATPDSYGSMLELAWRGTRPIELPSGQQRSFVEDGDLVKMTGWCQGDGYRVGFGEVMGRLLPGHDGRPGLGDSGGKI